MTNTHEKPTAVTNETLGKRNNNQQGTDKWQYNDKHDKATAVTHAKSNNDKTDKATSITHDGNNKAQTNDNSSK